MELLIKLLREVGHCSFNYSNVTLSFQESVTARSWLIKGKSPAKKKKKKGEKQFPTTSMAAHEMVLTLQYLLTEIVVRSQRSVTGKTSVFKLHF